ncbi:hypothetical protein TL16_g02516 [Triparma laevis f. inornata]|uniref:Uncharacterized protein n=1 Tax=Triparma laevis f. inornata TaxID=1714386 RepID=A0A9W7DWU5_9STRA|nr:hypothetical protein TL16_g02516 [Triparma laevis f. inornata]
MGKRPAATGTNLPPVSIHARITSVIDTALESIDQAIDENEVVRSSFRSLYDTTIEQYEFERDKVDREIARLPPTLAEYEKIRALERQQDLEAGTGTGGGVSHSLAFHLQKGGEDREIFAVDGSEDYGSNPGLDDQPLSFQQSAIDSRFPSPNRSTRGASRAGNIKGGVGSGSVASKKLSKQEKEEAKAWDTYDKFVNREEMFAKIADIQRMEQEIETRLASDNLTDRETQQLKKELDRTATRYSKYVLDMVGEYKPKLTATKLNNKDMHDLRDLSYLGVGMGSVAEIVSQMDHGYMMGEGGEMEEDEDDMIYDDDEYEEDGDGPGPEVKAGNYDMPDPQAWLRQQEEKKAGGRAGSPTSNLSGLEQADAAFDELNAFVANAMAESEQVAINDPFHLTNMQDLPIVRPSAPERGASREGGRVGTATRDIVQANTNHVDPYFPSLESFKTKEQDNAEYFMPGFQGKNFFKGVPQSAGAYWTAGRARTREAKEENEGEVAGGEKKKKKKKGRKGKKRKGRKGKRKEEEEGDWGEGDWGEEDGLYGEEDYEGEGGGEGEEKEIDEEAKAEIERLKKWKEEMRAYYGAGKGKGKGKEEEGGEEEEPENDTADADDATVDSIAKELPNPEQEHLYYEAAKISGKRALLTVSAASPTGGEGIKIQAIDVAQADSSPQIIKLGKDKVEQLFGDIESMTDEKKKQVGKELSSMLVFNDDGQLTLEEEKKVEVKEEEKEEKEEEVTETEVEEIQNLASKLASDVAQVAEENVGEKVVVDGAQEEEKEVESKKELPPNMDKIMSLASKLAEEVTVVVEKQLSHVGSDENPVTKIIVPSPKPAKRNTIRAGNSSGPTFTERLLHHAAVYTDELGNVTDEPQASDTFVASMLDMSVARVSSYTSASSLGVKGKEQKVEETVEEEKGEEKKVEEKKVEEKVEEEKEKVEEEEVEDKVEGEKLVEEIEEEEKEEKETNTLLKEMRRLKKAGFKEPEIKAAATKYSDPLKGLLELKLDVKKEEEKGEEKKEEGESNEAVLEIVGAIISLSVDEVVKEKKEVVAA